MSHDFESFHYLNPDVARLSLTVTMQLLPPVYSTIIDNQSLAVLEYLPVIMVRLSRYRVSYL